MFDSIKDIFRKRKIAKYISTIPTGMLPLREIRSANIIIDVEEPGFDELKETIMAWSRQSGIKTDIYFFDFRKLGKEELLLTSIRTTILKRELDWIGTPDLTKVAGIVSEENDLFISLVDNSKFPIDFLSKCSKARFKIGRHEYPGHAFDLIISGNQTADLRSDSKQIFKAIQDYLNMIS